MTEIFYLQLIISTIPNAINGTSPSIVTEDNIKLLFDIQKKVITDHANCFSS